MNVHSNVCELAKRAVFSSGELSNGPFLLCLSPGRAHNPNKQALVCHHMCSAVGRAAYRSVPEKEITAGGARFRVSRDYTVGQAHCRTVGASY